jgi:anti-anti-sigma regulatory factor
MVDGRLGQGVGSHRASISDQGSGRKLVSNDWKIYQLPARTSPADLHALQDFLRSCSDEPVTVSALRLRKLDTLTLQFLIAAAKSWTARGLRFEVTDISAEIGKVLGQLGVRPQMLTWKEGQ